MSATFEPDQIFAYASLLGTYDDVEEGHTTWRYADALLHIERHEIAHTNTRDTIDLGIQLCDDSGAPCASVFLARARDACTDDAEPYILEVYAFTPGPWCAHLEALAHCELLANPLKKFFWEDADPEP